MPMEAWLMLARFAEVLPPVISVPGLNLARLKISSLSLLQSLQFGVPKVFTADKAFPCHSIE